ncbi:MAG: hypothetical protein DRI36_04670 [Caldiserica bacterium]|nr:MAG: hypothetical protein DRI36_04670 [Caldisericota bacterium]
MGRNLVYQEKRKSGFPLGGRSRKWLALRPAVECSMSSDVKPPRGKPLSLYCRSIALPHCQTVSVLTRKAPSGKTASLYTLHLTPNIPAYCFLLTAHYLLFAIHHSLILSGGKSEEET